MSRRPARQWQLLVLACVAGLLVSLLPPAVPAQAANITVNFLDDPNPPTGSCPSTCTLRNAITAASANDLIQFQGGLTGTILLTQGLTLTKNVTIQGPGAASLILDGQNTVPVLTVKTGVIANISGLTVQRGLGTASGGINSEGGTVVLLNVIVRNNRGIVSGGIANASGSLTVTNSTITGNAADYGGNSAFVFGGGISSSQGTLVVSGSTVSDNVVAASTGYGGGIAVLGSVAHIERSTISGNSAPFGGGLVWTGLSGSLSVTNATISSNTGSIQGGGVYSLSQVPASLLHVTLSNNAGGGISTSGVVTLRNSIIASSSSGANCAVIGTGAINSTGNNLSDTAGCFQNGAQGDIVNGAPLLGPLALNSPGLTKTHALLPGSPALDGVTFNPSDCPATVVADQRGVSRPQIWAGSRCDIGAFELEANTPPTISNPGTQTVSEDGPFPAILVTVGDNEAPNSLTVTGSSSNPALLPSANISVSPSGLLRSVVATPLANQSGSTTITLTVNDGYTTTSTAFGLTVNAVNDAPLAANDAYTVDVTKPLTVPAATGVLANDSDIDSPSLSAVLVQDPAHGTVKLDADGGFTYQPTGTYTGYDTFTYRASDGSLNSVSPATVTIKVNAMACTPRPSVRPQLAVGGGKLLVHVESSPAATQQPSVLRELHFGALQNAKVTVGGQTMANNQTYIVPGNVTAIDFTVQRIVAGQPTTVPVTVIDDCGSWPTFVGGGPSAGF